jgi:hypothetical protein
MLGTGCSYASPSSYHTARRPRPYDCYFGETWRNWERAHSSWLVTRSCPSSRDEIVLSSAKNGKESWPKEGGFLMKVDVLIKHMAAG